MNGLTNQSFQRGLNVSQIKGADISTKNQLKKEAAFDEGEEYIRKRSNKIRSLDELDSSQRVTPTFEQWQVLFKSNKADLKSNEDGETTDESAPSSLESRDGRIRTRSDSVNSDISNITSFSEVSRGSVKSIFTGASNNSNKYLNSKETYSKVSNRYAINLSKIREDES